MTKSAARNQGHFVAIDGLRGIACLAVVAHHCYLHCGRFEWPLVHGFGRTLVLSHLFFYGNGGVELFFIVSGFCLAYPLWQWGMRETWTRWFVRRAYRILPPYYASAFIFWGLTSLLNSHRFVIFGMLTPLGGDVPLKELFVCFTLLNVFFNPSYWTLVLEARWYLVFPLLMRAARALGMSAFVLLAMLAGGLGLWLGAISPRFVFVTGQVFAYLPIFAAGILVARWAARGQAPRALVRHARLGLIASVVLVLLTVPSDGGSGPIPRLVPMGLLVFFGLVAALWDPVCSSLARFRPLVFVGGFSYSLYLIHEPFVHLVYAMLSQRSLSVPAQFVSYELVTLPLCVALGFLFYLLVERPCLRRARAIFKPASRNVSGVAVAAAEQPLDR